MTDMSNYCLMCGQSRNAEELLYDLQQSVRQHRDEHGDDRCWQDDELLYTALPEGYVAPERDTSVELENCKKYIACRQNPNTEYVSPQREIERLQAENADLKARLKAIYIFTKGCFNDPSL